VLTRWGRNLLTYALNAIKNMAGFEIESSKKGIQQKIQDSIVILPGMLLTLLLGTKMLHRAIIMITKKEILILYGGIRLHSHKAESGISNCTSVFRGKVGN